MICWKCRKETDIEKPVRGDQCPLCHADLHVCKACDFYESGAHNDCRESSADFVSDKERGNFCDYFRVNTKIAAGTAGNDKAAAKDAFNALFK
jgi:hypothetical protein